MKRFSLLLFSTFLFTACAQEEAVVEATAPEIEPVATEASPPNEPDAYYEYLWCKQGENYSDESFQAMVVDWNILIDSLENKTNAAFGYVPRGWEDPNFDALWVLRWADKAAMEAGWADYVAANGQQQIDEKYPGLLTCGSETGVDRFGFTAYIPRDMPANFGSTEPPYYLTNQFCTFNEGKGGADLRKVVGGTYLSLLDGGAAANPDSSYFFRIGAADFEPLPENPVNFNWVNLWNSAEEGEASSANFAASEEGQAMMAMFNEVATCNPQPAQAWDGYFIRRTPAS